MRDQAALSLFTFSQNKVLLRVCHHHEHNTEDVKPKADDNALDGRILGRLSGHYLPAWNQIRKQSYRPSNQTRQESLFAQESRVREYKIAQDPEDTVGAMQAKVDPGGS
jgi:hypothetical protein